MKEDNLLARKQLWILLSAIFLTSFSIIAFEISLSRILSVLLSYHYVFVVVSLALLGLGMGGMFVHFLRPRVPIEEKRGAVLASFSSIFSLSIALSIILVIKLGYRGIIQINILVYCILLLIPFFLAGVILAEAYRIFAAISTKIYGADLIGSASGSFGVILFLNFVASTSTALILSLVASVAAVFFAMGGPRKNERVLILSAATFFTVSIILVVSFFNGHQWDIPIGKNPNKEIHDALRSFGGKIVETRWSAFGRTDLIKFKDYPDHMDIYIDGTAGSPMYRFNGKVNDPNPAVSRLKTTFPGYFPFLFFQEEEKNNALLIGPGGGRDILLALMGGVQEITGVEINKDLVDLVRQYSWFNGNIYTGLKNVNIIVGEGRNFLQRQGEAYDLIMLSLPVTNTSRSLEGYALTENYLFTTESMDDYLDHLKDEGRLLFVGHNDAEILRLLSVSLAALRKRGVPVEKAMNQIYIVGSDDYLVFVLKKTPFKPTTVFQMYQAIRHFELESMLSYFPYIKEAGAINPALMALGSGGITLEDLEAMVRERGYDISPVEDNRPFFYKFEVGIPESVALVFWLSVILFALIIGIPPVYGWKRSIQERAFLNNKRSFKKVLLRSAVLFSMLGMGFMLIEISFIQRFILFLGHPVLSLIVLLFSLLAGAGIGSLWSGRFSSDQITKGISLSSLLIVGTVLVYTYCLPMLFNQLLGLSIAARVSITVIILIPLGFLMGIPFPLGIKWLKEKTLRNCIPWMWGINGASSVLGSTMTIVIAISFGFTEALLISAGCYCIVFLIFLRP